MDLEDELAIRAIIQAAGLSAKTGLPGVIRRPTFETAPMALTPPPSCLVNDAHKICGQFPNRPAKPFTRMIFGDLSVRILANNFHPAGSKLQYEGSAADGWGACACPPLGTISRQRDGEARLNRWVSRVGVLRRSIVTGGKSDGLNSGKVAVILIGGEQIRTARQLLGWSQVALAVRAGVGINQLKNFESGVTAPRSATIAALRRRLETANVQFIAKNRRRGRRAFADSG